VGAFVPGPQGLYHRPREVYVLGGQDQEGRDDRNQIERKWAAPIEGCRRQLAIICRAGRACEGVSHERGFRTKFIRPIVRPPIAQERIRLTREGDVLELRQRWSDGTTHLRFHPWSCWSGWHTRSISVHPTQGCAQKNRTAAARIRATPSASPASPRRGPRGACRRSTTPRCRCCRWDDWPRPGRKAVAAAALGGVVAGRVELVGLVRRDPERIVREPGALLGVVVLIE
jgi:hypothetical protein